MIHKQKIKHFEFGMVMNNVGLKGQVAGGNRKDTILNVN